MNNSIFLAELLKNIEIFFIMTNGLKNLLDQLYLLIEIWNKETGSGEAEFLGGVKRLTFDIQQALEREELPEIQLD